jgi:putative nucleotidyltransferase with HDIG domain
MLRSTAPKTRRLSIANAVTDESAPATGADFDALVARGQEEERAGRREAARAAYERAMQQVRTTADAAQVSSVLRWIARTYHVDGNVAAARDCLDAALALADLWHDDAAAGHAMNMQAVVSWQRGELDEAERLYLLARGRAVVASDARLAAKTAQNLGVLANIRGDFEIAEAQYLASLAEYRSLGLTTDVCIALNNLGLLYIAQQRWAEAECSLREGAQISALSGDLMTRTQLDINLAELWVKRGEFGRAQDAVRKALDAASQTGDASAIGKATKLLGVIARDTGHLSEADLHFQHADELAIARGEVLMQAEIARERADLARRMGKNREVLQQLNRSHRLFTILRAQPDLVDLDQRVGDLEQEFLHVARRWGESIEAKDRYTQGHCHRVAELACAIARKSGLDEHALFWFRIGALLHDVGKLVIPEDVLNKPGKLDEHEWTLMRSHTTAGVEMLADIEFPWDVRPLIESHHERWDGRGYPHGLAGEDIPLIARILSIADVYDALTSVRSYKAAQSHADAMEMLRRDIGTAFDPQVFAWFEEFLCSGFQLTNQISLLFAFWRSIRGFYHRL